MRIFRRLQTTLHADEDETIRKELLVRIDRILGREERFKRGQDNIK